MNRRIACIRLPSPPTGAPAPAAEARAALAGALLRAAPRVTPVRGHPRALWADDYVIGLPAYQSTPKKEGT